MVNFYADKLFGPRLTSRLEVLPLLAVHDCVFNIFVAFHHIGGRSSIHNLGMHHAKVTGTHLSQNLKQITFKITNNSLDVFIRIEIVHSSTF
jgi:hypothetical protein